MKEDPFIVTVEGIIYVILGLFGIFTLCLFLSSCNMAKRCARLYPPIIYDSTRIEVTPGETVYRFDTVTVDCDSVFQFWNKKQALTPGIPAIFPKTGKVRVPCPPSTHRIDTITIDKTKTIVSTAERDALRIAESKLTTRTRNMWIAIVIAALLLGILISKPRIPFIG